MPNYDSTSRQPFKEGGRAGLIHGGKPGDKGPLQKVYEKIGRKWRGKEKTKVKGIEQDVKTGALTHKAPEDRLDTQAGRAFLNICVPLIPNMLATTVIHKVWNHIGSDPK